MYIAAKVKHDETVILLKKGFETGREQAIHSYISRSLAQKRTFIPIKLSKDVIIFTCCHYAVTKEGVTNTCQLFMS